MSLNLREIIKKTGITQQELADYLGITRQYLNNYLDETIDEPKMPQKFMDNILFLFECKTRDELFDNQIVRNAKTIKKRINNIRITKESLDHLFNIENEKKIELFKIVEYFSAFTKLDVSILESLVIFMENISKETPYRSILSYIGKRYMIIDFDHPDYNNEVNKAREALFYKALESETLDFNMYKELYDDFSESIKEKTDIDLEALKKSLNELGYTNISQKEVIDILKKYNQIKINKEIE